LYLNRQIKQLYNQSTNRAATYQSIQARRKQYKVNKAKASEASNSFAKRMYITAGSFGGEAPSTFF